MTTGVETEAANLLLPTGNSAGMKAIAVLSVTTNSQIVDLSSLFGNWEAGHFYTLVADFPDNPGSRVYVALHANNTGTASATATGTGSTVAVPIPDNQAMHGKILSGRIGVSGMATSISSQWLSYVGLATGYLRIYRSSVLPGQRVDEFPPP